jgi:hypothetical protein
MKERKKFVYPIEEPQILPDGSVLLDSNMEDSSSEDGDYDGLENGLYNDDRMERDL